MNTNGWSVSVTRDGVPDQLMITAPARHNARRIVEELQHHGFEVHWLVCVPPLKENPAPRHH